MTETTGQMTAAAPAAMTEAAAVCMRATAELQSRLTASWLELLTHGFPQPSAVAAWSLEAMRLTTETTLRNIEHCQNCAHHVAGEPK